MLPGVLNELLSTYSTNNSRSRLQSKVTFTRIKEHLESVYKTKISYGLVVELRVTRNKCRRSACRYNKVAHVTCRIACKGFQLKYNPDSH